MSQYDVLVAMYEESKKIPDKKFSSKEIVTIVSKKFDFNETSIKRSVGVLVYWSFLRRSIDKAKWKDEYTITARGMTTALNLEKYYTKT
jgi:hypothetical protein